MASFYYIIVVLMKSRVSSVLMLKLVNAEIILTLQPAYISNGYKYQLTCWLRCAGAPKLAQACVCHFHTPISCHVSAAVRAKTKFLWRANSQFWYEQWFKSSNSSRSYTVLVHRFHLCHFHSQQSAVFCKNKTDKPTLGSMLLMQL